MKQKSNHVIVIGGGAAGMMAALSAARAGANVTLLERNEKLGRKLYITGKGRCNLTNRCSAEQVLSNIPRNPKFLYSAMVQFPPEDVVSFFEDLSLPTKTERGGRVFPCSDRSADVIDVLRAALRRQGVRILYSSRGCWLLTGPEGVCGVKLETGEKLACDRVILATGGVSYPQTGSTGDGYAMANAVGHSIVSPRGSLVALVEDGADCAGMQGLTLKNIAIRVSNRRGKVVYQDFGELLFTHFGLSGPVILSASAHMQDFERERYVISIDLKPALNEQKLDNRIMRDFAANQNRKISKILDLLLPRAMIPVVLERADIVPETVVHDVTKEQRRALARVLKHFDVPVSSARPTEEAVVTSGGIKVNEINPSTMESKLCPSLYFAGEVIDVDAYTGGFNLQIAWATGHLAGICAGADVCEGKEREG